MKKAPKPQSKPKRNEIKVCVTPDQREILTAAAKKSGLGVSSWLRSIGLLEAVSRP